MTEAENQAPNVTNVAFRLHKYLSNARTLNQGATHQQLGTALDVPQGDMIAFLRALVETTVMVDEIEKLVRDIPTANHQMFLRGLDRLKGGLVSAATNQDFEQWKKNYIPNEIVDRVEFCADLISKHYPEVEIAQGELDQITKDVQGIYDSVITSSIGADLKATVLELLESIRQAIHQYRMKGVCTLKDALAAATGQLVLHREEVTEAAKSENKPLLDKLFQLLDRIDKAVSVATKAKPLLASAMKYYPMLLAAGEKLADKLK